MRVALLLVLLLVLLPALSAAASFVEDFSTSKLDSAASTGVWNLASRRLHVPFIVDRTNDATHDEDDSVPLGAGGDGAFSASTLAAFDLDSVDGTVTLSGDRVYEFTTFTLPSTKTLLCQGSSPLRIRVQGDANIDGPIDLRGRTGAAGGGGSCGGGDGGTGGTNSAGTDGESGHPTIDGGGGAGTTGTASGGGGGHFAAGAAGTGGAGGLGYGNTFLEGLYGGSGGGGGASNSGAQAGNGGGGGGSLFLSAGGTVSLGSQGKLLSSGGNGSAGTGGGGGGGSGGSLLVFAGGNYSHNATAEIFAVPGTGGGTAGAGEAGRVRIENTDSLVVNGSGNLDPAPQEPEGRVRYTQTAAVIVSQAYDTGLTSPHYEELEVAESTTGGTISYEVAASSDNFVSDDTGFVARTALSQLNGKRYFKYRVTLTSTNPLLTPYVTSLTMRASEGLKSEFVFQSVACNAVHQERLSLQAVFGSMLFLTYLALFPWLLRKTRLIRPTASAGAESRKGRRRVVDDFRARTTGRTGVS